MLKNSFIAEIIIPFVFLIAIGFVVNYIFERDELKKQETSLVHLDWKLDAVNFIEKTKLFECNNGIKYVTSLKLDLVK